MTQVPPLALIGSGALWCVNRNIVVSGAEEKQKKRKKHLFGGTRRCEIGQWREMSRGRCVAAAAGVEVYIENNRGGCFDARRSAACFGLQSKTHRQCRK